MKKEYLWGLMTVLFWSTSATAFELTLRYLDVFQVLFYGIITSTVILGVYLKITGKFDNVFGFAFITWITALRLSGNTGRVANLVFLTPFISLIFICFVLGESIEARTWVGLFLIVTGIGIQKYQEVKKN
ncbi:DMT family transporter [uncultured Desulfobacter sp.]|uniref:DMT family transporter n=1 Tax=uncultured Desulfobacter sp. TaxID=240139 RepID=UPI0029F4BABE|nr:DMT family transporter [uncultured Desulfobacter sp.]